MIVTFVLDSRKRAQAVLRADAWTTLYVYHGD